MAREWFYWMIIGGGIFENCPNRVVADLWLTQTPKSPKLKNAPLWETAQMPETLTYQREDWTDFRNLATLIR